MANQEMRCIHIIRSISSFECYFINIVFNFFPRARLYIAKALMANLVFANFVKLKKYKFLPKKYKNFDSKHFAKYQNLC